MTFPIHTIPPDTLTDVLACLERNEIEKCQLVAKFLNNFITSLGKILPLRGLRQHDLVITSDRAFFLQNPSKYGKYDPDLWESINVMSDAEIKCLRYCCPHRIRISRFDEKILEYLEKAKEISGEKVKVKEFRYF